MLAKVAAPPSTSFNTLVGVLMVSSAVEPKTVSITYRDLLFRINPFQIDTAIMCKNFDEFFKLLRATKINENLRLLSYWLRLDLELEIAKLKLTPEIFTWITTRWAKSLQTSLRFYKKATQG